MELAIVIVVLAILASPSLWKYAKNWRTNWKLLHKTNALIRVDTLGLTNTSTPVTRRGKDGVRETRVKLLKISSNQLEKKRE